jgi:outer membrane immunogenic protein
MRNMGKILLLSVSLLTASVARGQDRSANRVSLAVTYNAVYAGLSSGNQFWLNGGSVEAALPLYRGLGAVANVTGLTSSNTGNGVPLSLVTTTFGPRYRWTPKSKNRHSPSFYAEALLGVANGFHGLFPEQGGTVTQAKGLAVRAGGGMDIKLTSVFSLRPIEANWLRTQLPNATTNAQNDFQLGGGVVIFLHK